MPQRCVHTNVRIRCWSDALRHALHADIGKRSATELSPPFGCHFDMLLACTIRSGFGIKVCLIQSDSSLRDRLQKKNAISEAGMADTEVV